MLMACCLHRRLFNPSSTLCSPYGCHLFFPSHTDNLFKGEMQNTITLAHSTHSTTTEAFYAIPLVFLLLPFHLQEVSHMTSLEDSLRSYFTPERLTGPNGVRTSSGAKKTPRVPSPSHDCPPFSASSSSDFSTTGPPAPSPK